MSHGTSIATGLRRLPASAEFAVVITLCFGYFIWQTLEALAIHSVGAHPVFSDGDALRMIEYELIAYPLALAILATRGWRISSFDLSPTLVFSAVGILLFALYDGVYLTALSLNAALSGSGTILQPHHLHTQVSPAVAVVVAVINPLFKELVVVGYVVRSFENVRGPLFAILASALLRTLYHLDQGMIAAATVLLLGVVFAWVYWRWRTLWPLVLAHGLTDYLSLH